MQNAIGFSFFSVSVKFSFTRPSRLQSKPKKWKTKETKKTKVSETMGAVGNGHGLENFVFFVFLVFLVLEVSCFLWLAVAREVQIFCFEIFEGQ